MKVLLSAIACNPYLGSENYFGWSAIKALADDHELWVLTGSRNTSDLQRAADEGLVPENVRFVFAGQHADWHPNRMRARMQSWQEYIRFSKALLPLARQLHRKEKFSVAHHVTYSTWRVASPLCSLGVPLVFGPVGGCERFPLRLFPILSPSASMFEIARGLSNVVSRWSPGIRRCIRSAAHVFAANIETKRLVQTLRRSADGVSELSAGFFFGAKIQALASAAASKEYGGPLRLFAGGCLEGRKGVALALLALAEAKRYGVKFKYRLAGGGPELPHLKRMAVRLGLESDVNFIDNLGGEAYHGELGMTHIFLLPSFRESAGLTMMEAMLARAVPLVADSGGPSMIVDDQCGYKIPVGSTREMAGRIAERIVALDRNRELIKTMGLSASLRIASHFSETNYRKMVGAVYQFVTKPN